MPLDTDDEVALRDEVVDARTPQARVPYALMELTGIARNQVALEDLLLELVRPGERGVVRRMAVECVGHMVRDRRRITTDRIPLTVCDLLTDDDDIVRDNAAEALYELRYWLSASRRAAGIPMDCLVPPTDAAVLRAGTHGGENVWIGSPEDRAVARIGRLVAGGGPLTTGLANAVVTSLDSGGDPHRSRARYVHLSGPHRPWWVWVFASGQVERLSYRAPHVGRIAPRKVPRRRVKAALERWAGQDVRLDVVRWPGRDGGSTARVEDERSRPVEALGAGR